MNSCCIFISLVFPQGLGSEQTTSKGPNTSSSSASVSGMPQPIDLPIKSVSQSSTVTSIAEDISIKLQSAKHLWDTPAPVPMPNLNESVLSPPSMASVNPAPASSHQTMSESSLDPSGVTEETLQMESELLTDVPPNQSASHRPLVSDSTIMMPAISSSSDTDFAEFSHSSSLSGVDSVVTTTVSSSYSELSSESIDMNQPSSSAPSYAPFTSSYPSFSSYTSSSVSNSMQTSEQRVLPIAVSNNMGNKNSFMYAAIPNQTMGTQSLNSTTLLYSPMVGLDGKVTTPDQNKMQQYAFGRPAVLIAPTPTVQVSSAQPQAQGGSASQSMFSGQSSNHIFSAFPIGDNTPRLIQPPAAYAPAQYGVSVIQPPSATLQYNLNQTPAVAPSPPAAAAQQSFAPLSFLQAANLTGPGISSALSQPSQATNQPYLSYGTSTFTRPDINIQNNAIKPQSSFNGLSTMTKTVASLPYGTVPSINMQQQPIYGQQRATTPVGSQTRLLGNALVTPIMQSNIHQATQPTSFFTANNSGPSQPTAVGSAGSTNFFNSLQGNHAAAAAAAAVQQPQGAQHMQSLNTIQIQTAAAAAAAAVQPPPQPQHLQQHQQHQQHPQPHPQPAPMHYPSQGTMQYSQSRPVGLGGPYSSQPGTTRHTTHNVSSGDDRKPMLDLSASSTSVMNEMSYMVSPRSSDMQQHVDAKPFSPNRVSSSSQPPELQRSSSHSDMPAPAVATSNPQFASGGHPTIKATFPNAPTHAVRQPYGHQNQPYQQQQQQQTSFMPRAPSTTQAPVRGMTLRPGPPPQQSSQIQPQGFQSQPVPHQLIRFPAAAAQVRFRPPMPQANMSARLPISSASSAGPTPRSVDHNQPGPAIVQSSSFTRKPTPLGVPSKAPPAPSVKPTPKPAPQAPGDYKPTSSEGPKSKSSEREALIASTKAFFTNLKNQSGGKPGDKASTASSGATQSDGSQGKGTSNKN